MSQYEPDPIAEAHKELDQLTRVTMAGLMQVSEAVARRGARQAGAQRDEQVAIAQAAGAQLEADYGTQGPAQALSGGHPGQEALSGPGPSVVGEATLLGYPGQPGPASVDLTSESGLPVSRTGATGSGLGPDDSAHFGSGGDGPVAVPGSLAALLDTAHPLPVRQELAAAAASPGPGSGDGAGADMARRLGAVQGVGPSADVGLG